LEISPGVHAVQLLGAHGHVFFEPRLTLIDTGLRGSSRLLERYLARHGRSISEIDRIICTHGHPDHAGGIRELASRDVEVLMHPADLDGIQVDVRGLLKRPSRGRFFASMTPVPEAASPLVDGDVLPVAGGLEVIHTPGHTPGSICLYARRDRLLFVGDVLQRRRSGEVIFASSLYSDDVATSRASVKRLAALDVDMIVFSHYPPVREAGSAILADLVRRDGSGARPGRVEEH
jgi:glyoxylase-like metal-dependent hydrolase (beta-lactamase superfamily II)